MTFSRKQRPPSAEKLKASNTQEKELSLKKKDLYNRPITDIRPFTPFPLEEKRVYRNFNPMGHHYLSLKELTKSPESFRDYIPGDPPKLIDWRAYARTGELKVRQEIKPSQKKIGVFLDMSSSMAWPDEKTREQTNKREQSKIALGFKLGLHLAYQKTLIHHHVDFSLFGDQETRTIIRPSKNKLLYLEHLFDQTSEIPIEKFPQNEDLLKTYEKIYLISDLFQKPTRIPKTKQMTLLHLLSHLELEDSWLSQSSLYYHKGEKTKKTSGDHLLQKKNLKKKVEDWLGKKREEYKQQGHHYLLISNRSTLGEYLKGIRE